MKIAASDVQMMATSSSSTQVFETKTMTATRGAPMRLESQSGIGAQSKESNAREQLDENTRIDISRLSQLLQKIEAELSPATRPEVEPQSQVTEVAPTPELEEEELDPRVQLIRSLIEYMLGKSIDLFPGWRGQRQKCDTDCRQAQPQVQGAASQSTPTPRNSDWKIEYHARRVVDIQENSNFQAQGTVRTSDGKSIQFDLSFELQRQTHTETAIDVITQAQRKVDPLMLNFGEGPVQLTDHKFAFDLNADGSKEQISFASNAGFLALDLNKNGKIDDGRELFGPSTNNGFAELQKYDVDHNGWIDENDPVYEKLQVWSKDASGADQLLNLKQAQVGALCLTNVASRFTVTGTQQQALGQLAASGIWLSEQGKVHQLQQIDLVV